MIETPIRESFLTLLRDAQPVTWAYLDASRDVPDPRGYVTSVGTSTIDSLLEAGAPREDAEAIVGELSEPPGVPSPVSRYVLARGGEVVVSELLPGEPRLPHALGHGPVADVLPVLAHRPIEVSYLVVEAGRDGGGFRTFRYGAVAPEGEDQVQGRTDTLHKFQGGGWAHRNMQSHTEEIWRQNVAELAKAVDVAARRASASLIVVAGDIHARRLLEAELTEESRRLLSTVPVDTRAPDASDEALVSQVEQELARIIDEREADALELLEANLGRGDGTAVTRVGEVVAALASAQVETLLIDPAALGDRTLLALGGEPWLATAPEGALDATVLGEEPAASVLVRAAVLTDARIVLTSNVTLPDGNGVAATLRWPVGPPPPR